MTENIFKAVNAAHKDIEKSHKKAAALKLKKEQEWAERQEEIAMENEAENGRNSELAATGKLKIKSTKSILGNNNKMTKMEKVQSELKVQEEFLKQKADLKDLKKLAEIKSNKFDTEFLMQCMDLTHKQLTHLTCLLIETMKTLVEDQNISV